MAGPNIQGLVSDPAFGNLPLAQQRAALAGITGDQSFASLSDVDTEHFVSHMRPQVPAGLPKPFAPVEFPAPAPPDNVPPSITEGFKGLGKGVAREILQPEQGFSGFTPEMQRRLAYTNRTQAAVGNRVSDISTAASIAGGVEAGYGALKGIKAAISSILDSGASEADVGEALDSISKWWKSRGGVTAADRPNGPIRGQNPNRIPPGTIPPAGPNPYAPAYPTEESLRTGLGRVQDIAPDTSKYPTEETLREALARVRNLSSDVPAATTPGSGIPAASAPATTAPAEAAAAPPALTQGESVSPAIRSKLDQALRDSLGALPPPRAGAPIANRPVVAAPAAPKLPEGFTPVESSSVLKGYKYDPEAQELEAITNSGQRYRTGEVTQEQFDKFEAADSKGKAWNALRGNSTPLGKYVGGKFQPYSRAGMRSATPEDVPPSAEPGELDDTLTKMLKQVKAGKKLKDLQ